jgi:excisionase family DNA binding protein
VKQHAEFTIVQAADRLGLTRQRLYQLIHAGKLPARRVPTYEYRIDGRALDALIAERSARKVVGARS